MYQVSFYVDSRGREPVKEFIESLQPKTQAKLDFLIQLLEEQGPFLRRPYADKVRDKLYELRLRMSSDEVRILYFFFMGDKIILTHALRKKDNELRLRDIELAERRMIEFIHRVGK